MLCWCAAIWRNTPIDADPPATTGRAPMKAIGFIGDSGSGKTTLVERLIARFVRGGWRVAAIKHAHHGFDIDRPGKDSYRFRAAGAAQVLIASDQRWVLMSDESADPTAADPAAALVRQMSRLDPCDLVLVEGYRGQAGIPFIEIRRTPAAAPAGDPAPRPAPAGRIAVASDAALAPQAEGSGLPLLDLNDIEAVARFIAARMELPLC
jgi:molybdopterin-guanine dinucleotide biosynthesis protein B